MDEHVKQASRLHEHLMALWRSYQDLAKQLVVAEQTLGELRTEHDRLGRLLQTLYHISDNGLNERKTHDT